MSLFDKITNSNTNQLNYIFPESTERKRMSFVFAGLSCLICLCFLAISAGMSAGEHWSDAFEKTYVMELRPVAEMPRDQQISQANRLLSDLDYVADYTLVSDQEMAKLMSPWLGDELLLTELPLSQLIKITLSSDNIRKSLDELTIKISKIPGASIEGYHAAKMEYKSAAHAIKLVSLSATILLIFVTAIVTAVSIESGVLDNKKIINIMRLIGTDNHLIINLFVRCTLERAVKGALAGMVMACAVLALISLLGAIKGLGVTFIFSSFVPSINTLFLLMLVPLTVVAAGYFAGKHTMNKLIKNFI